MRQLHYILSWAKPHTHRLQVVLEIFLESPDVPASPFMLQIPRWRPGRYHYQDFAAGISFVKAFSGEEEVPLKQRSPEEWACQLGPGTQRLQLTYEVSAHQLDAGSTFVGPSLLVLNPINWAVRPKGWEEVPCQLELPDLAPTWHAATPLTPLNSHVFSARSYHELVDSPLIASPVRCTWSIGSGGTTIQAHFAGPVQPNPAWEADFAAQVAAIVQAQIQVFGHWPVEDTYHLLYVLGPINFRHAVEHERSAIFILPSRTTDSQEAFETGVLGITAHELFHTWNVKRLRPKVMVPYDYQHLPQTELHWFTEGLTCYYEELSQVRGGVISHEAFFSRISETLTKVFQSPGAAQYTIAEQCLRSHHTTSPYRSALERVSFYDTGQLLALGLDLQLRVLGATLDEVLRLLYTRHASDGFTYADLLQALEDKTGVRFEPFLNQWLYEARLPLFPQLFDTHSLDFRLDYEEHVTWQDLGVEIYSESGEGLTVLTLRPESPLQQAGLPGGATLLDVDAHTPTPQQCFEPWTPLTIDYSYWGHDYRLALPPAEVVSRPHIVLGAGHASEEFLTSWLGPTSTSPPTP